MRFLELAEGTTPLRTSGFPWPWSVALSVEGPTGKVAFSEGVGHASAGGTFSPVDALDGRWRENFRNTGGDGRLPRVARLARGERVTEGELVAEYRTRHGTDPSTVEWNV